MPRPARARTSTGLGQDPATQLGEGAPWTHPTTSEPWQTERLKALDWLSDEDLVRPVGEHWTVAVALCHIAHVDERVLAVLELSLRHGIPRVWWTMDEALAINGARLPLWRALPAREALRRAILTAEALDRVIRDLPADVAEAVATERARSLDRSLHRAEHLDEVAQALEA